MLSSAVFVCRLQSNLNLFECSSAVCSSIPKWKALAQMLEVWGRDCLSIFFNKKGNNNKSYKLITHLPITPSFPPLSPETQDDAALHCCRLQLHHSSCVLSGRWFDWVCGGRSCKSGILSICLCVFGCWQEWKTALGRMWACVGVYGAVLGCMSECDSQKCINQNRSSSPTQSLSVAARAFLPFIFSPVFWTHCTSFHSSSTFSSSSLEQICLGGPCIISSSGGC